MSAEFDVIILGLGAMGAATLYQCAKRGRKVLGIDQFSPPHTNGSSHGDTRITRQAIGEGDYLSNFSIRSYDIFRELEQKTGKSLLTVTGGLMISSPARTSKLFVDDFFATTLSAAKRFNVRHDVLDANEVRKRFSQFNVHDDETGYYEYEAGFLRPEECIAAELMCAEQLGAQIHRNEKVTSFNDEGTGVRVITDSGEYRAKNLVVCAGPWLQTFLDEELNSLFKVYRQVLFWFDASDAYADFRPGTFPIFIWEVQGPVQSIYGFPAVDGPRGGIKIAASYYAEPVDPDKVDRTVSMDEAQRMYEEQIVPFFPKVGRECLRSSVCMYTSTVDARFLIDRHPQFRNVIICSPCSGHGFKHSAAIGESITQMIFDGSSKIDLTEVQLKSHLDARSLRHPEAAAVTGEPVAQTALYGSGNLDLTTNR